MLNLSEPPRSWSGVSNLEFRYQPRRNTFKTANIHMKESMPTMTLVIKNTAAWFAKYCLFFGRRPLKGFIATDLQLKSNRVSDCVVFSHLRRNITQTILSTTEDSSQSMHYVTEPSPSPSVLHAESESPVQYLAASWGIDSSANYPIWTPVNCDLWVGTHFGNPSKQYTRAKFSGEHKTWQLNSGNYELFLWQLSFCRIIWITFDYRLSFLYCSEIVYPNCSSVPLQARGSSEIEITFTDWWIVSKTFSWIMYSSVNTSTSWSKRFSHGSQRRRNNLRARFFRRILNALFLLK